MQQFRNTCLTHTGYPTVKVTRQNKYNLKYGMHLCLCVHKIYFLERKNPGEMNNILLVDKMNDRIYDLWYQIHDSNK